MENTEFYWDDIETHKEFEDSENGLLYKELHHENDKLITTYESKMSSEEIETDLLILRHLTNDYLEGVEVVNNCALKVDTDECWGTQILYDDDGNITCVSRIDVNNQNKDGVSTSYNSDGTISKIEIYEDGVLSETILS